MFTRSWMDQWEGAAKMLVTHFQIALTGAVPFSLNWEDNQSATGGNTATMPKRKGKRKAMDDPVADAKMSANMDDEAADFMGHLCRMLRVRGRFFYLSYFLLFTNYLKIEEEFSGLTTEKSNCVDMIWVSQLFVDRNGK